MGKIGLKSVDFFSLETSFKIRRSFHKKLILHKKKILRENKWLQHLFMTTAPAHGDSTYSQRQHLRHALQWWHTPE